MGEPDAGTAPASAIVAEAVRRVAIERVALNGPHWISVVVHATRELTLPPTSSTAGGEPLGERLDQGAPLTPLADPATGGDGLGAWGVSPSTVGDLLEARDTEGRRVAGELELQCALDAARQAPALADQLARDHPGLADALAVEHARALVDGGSVDPAAVLCAEIAAVLTVELVVLVREQLAKVPISPA